MTTTTENSQHYLELLSRFSTDLINKQTVEDILWSITDNAIAELGFEDCIVYMMDADRNFLIQRAAFGPKNRGKHEVLEPIQIPIGVGVVGYVAKSGVAEIVEDCSLDPRYIKDDLARNSEITVPIIQDGVVIGVIDSENTRLGFYNSEHLSVLSAIASITAIRLSQVESRRTVMEARDLLQQEVAVRKSELQTAMHQLRQSNLQLEKLVEEKNLLLRQLHHRVMNQMQMMHSLINLQSAESEHELVKETLHICLNRVRCMGLVYQLADRLTIDLGKYLTTLHSELKGSAPHNAESGFQISVDGGELSTDKAVYLGFILVDLFHAGLGRISEVENPGSSIDVIVDAECRITFSSNWWGFDRVGELTALFISQIGAKKLRSDSQVLSLGFGR